MSKQRISGQLAEAFVDALRRPIVALTIGFILGVLVGFAACMDGMAR